MVKQLVVFHPCSSQLKKLNYDIEKFVFLIKKKKKKHDKQNKTFQKYPCDQTEQLYFIIKL